jgi:hypothetical protein
LERKTSKWRISQDGAGTTVFFFWLLHSHFSTEYKMETFFKLVVTSTMALQLARKKITQNGVNIQDGDFAFIHPSV